MIEEDEPIVGIREEEILNLRPLRQEREARVDVERHGSWRKVDEIEMFHEASDVVRLVNEEEPFQGLGELLAVKGVVDEVAPGLGDALESADGPGGETREDLHDGVIGEASRRAPLGAIHAADSDLRSGESS